MRWRCSCDGAPPLLLAGDVSKSKPAGTATLLPPLQEELQADGPGVGSKEAAVQPAADARDFADEAELIEDAEQQAAMADVAAAMHQHQLGLVSAALQAGAAAEDENYDFDEEEPRVVGPPQLAVIAAGSPAPPIGAIAVGQTPWAAYRHRVHLPVLGQSLEGEAVLRFSELYGHQGVMAGHVASTDDLRPQPLLFRGQRRQAAELAREEQTEVGPGDEEALLQAADIEVPAGVPAGFAAPLEAVEEADVRMCIRWSVSM